jgi:fused signal recognition particle receptor
MFSLFKTVYEKLHTVVAQKIASLFGRASIDQATLDELERLLIVADVGTTMTKNIIKRLQKNVEAGTIVSGTDLHAELAHIVRESLQALPYTPIQNGVIVLIGVNGSGKTSSAAKLAYRYKKMGKKVLLVAADTFRAAAVEQLATWAERIDVDIVRGNEKQDPAAVVFVGCEQFRSGNYDVIIVDTAGRLQNKVNLMSELAKVRRVIDKQINTVKTPADNNNNIPIHTLLTVDSMLGQNSFEQAKIFGEAAPLDGIILTKMDGSAKGGMILAIGSELSVPIAYVSFGEQIEMIKEFDIDEFVNGLLGE